MSEFQSDPHHSAEEPYDPYITFFDSEEGDFFDIPFEKDLYDGVYIDQSNLDKWMKIYRIGTTKDVYPTFSQIARDEVEIFHRFVADNLIRRKTDTSTYDRHSELRAIVPSLDYEKLYKFTRSYIQTLEILYLSNVIDEESIFCPFIHFIQKENRESGIPSIDTLEIPFEYLTTFTEKTGLSRDNAHRVMKSFVSIYLYIAPAGDKGMSVFA